MELSWPESSYFYNIFFSLDIAPQTVTKEDAHVTTMLSSDWPQHPTMFSSLAKDRLCKTEDRNPAYHKVCMYIYMFVELDLNVRLTVFVPKVGSIF